MERKKAIVTGASRGIGKGIALALAREGYDVAISYATKAAEAEALAAHLMDAYGARCYPFQASLERAGEATRFFAHASESLGGLDLLVNNAGVTIFESLLDLHEETLDTLINLDFRTCLVLMSHAARLMVNNRTAGSIVNITSTRAQQTYRLDAVYGGVKAAIERATRSAALELAAYGIRANIIAPGSVCVRSQKEISEISPDEFLARHPDFWETLGKKVPLGRAGTPADIAEAVVYLASDKAAYITGATLCIDGGLTLPGMPEYEDDYGSTWL